MRKLCSEYYLSLSEGLKGNLDLTFSKHGHLRNDCALKYLFCILTAIEQIEGNYTEWASWSVCSSTCGGGSQARSRTCTNPAPQDGGKNCTELGPVDQTQDCNLDPCREFFSD